MDGVPSARALLRECAPSAIVAQSQVIVSSQVVIAHIVRCGCDIWHYSPLDYLYSKLIYRANYTAKFLSAVFANLEHSGQMIGTVGAI